MPISTTCPTCQAIFRLGEELAGRTVQCQKCQGLFIVPASGVDTLLAPGTMVPGQERRAAADAKAAPDAYPLPAPPRPEEIPVTAKIAADEPEDRADEDERDDRTAPDRRPRSKSRNRNEERTKPRSKALPIVLALLGVSLFLCVGMGAAGIVWVVAARGHHPRQIAPRPNLANELANFVPTKRRAPTAATEIKLDKKGGARVETELTMQDPRNADGRRHKHFAVRLEAGKRYQIDMESPLFDTLLILTDDANKMVAFNDDIDTVNRNQNSRIVFTPKRTAVYKIEATFWLNPPEFGPQEPVGAFDLTVRELKR